MSDGLSRRDFVAAGLTAAVVAGKRAAFAQAPAVAPGRASKPIVIASANGHHYKNGGETTCVEEAFQRMARGEDVLDALVAGVNILELDPEDSSVGYGGLPNADGVVQLDSCCMHGPRKRAGGVAVPFYPAPGRSPWSEPRARISAPASVQKLARRPGQSPGATRPGRRLCADP